MQPNQAGLVSFADQAAHRRWTLPPATLIRCSQVKLALFHLMHCKASAGLGKGRIRQRRFHHTIWCNLIRSDPIRALGDMQVHSIAWRMRGRRGSLRFGEAMHVAFLAEADAVWCLRYILQDHLTTHLSVVSLPACCSARQSLRFAVMWPALKHCYKHPFAAPVCMLLS